MDPSCSKSCKLTLKAECGDTVVTLGLRVLRMHTGQAVEHCIGLKNHSVKVSKIRSLAANR